MPIVELTSGTPTFTTLPSPASWHLQGSQFKDQDGRVFQPVKILEGGWGRVTIVDSIDTKERLALKTYLDGPHQSRRAALFTAEVTRWLQLGPHPHIVRPYYVVLINERPHILMEFVDSSLRDMLRRERCSSRDAIALALQICLGMDHAETTLAMVHRDLKPSNILISRTKVAKVCDFGIASRLGEDKAATFHSDVFSFGVIMYEMLSGGLPDLDTKHGSVVLPLSLRARLPKALIAVLTRCLAASPEERYDNFDGVVRDLTNVCHQTSAALPEGMTVFPGVGVLSTDSILPRELRTDAGNSLRPLGSGDLLDRAIGARNTALSLIRLERNEEAVGSLRQAVGLEARIATSWARDLLRAREENRPLVGVHALHAIKDLETRVGMTLYNKAVALALRAEWNLAEQACRDAAIFLPGDHDLQALLERIGRRGSLQSVPLKVDRHFLYATDKQQWPGKLDMSLFWEGYFAPDTLGSWINEKFFPDEHWHFRCLLARSVAEDALGQQMDHLARCRFKRAAELALPLRVRIKELTQEAKERTEAFESRLNQDDLMHASRAIVIGSDVSAALVGLLEDGRSMSASERATERLLGELSRTRAAHCGKGGDSGVWDYDLGSWVGFLILHARLEIRGAGFPPGRQRYENGINICEVLSALFERFSPLSRQIDGRGRATFVLMAGAGYRAIGDLGKANDALRTAAGIYRRFGHTSEATACEDALARVLQSSPK